MTPVANKPCCTSNLILDAAEFPSPACATSHGGLLQPDGMRII